MKITALHTAQARVPLDKPIRTSIHTIEAMSCLLVTLETDDGMSGEGVAFSFNPAHIASVEPMVRGLEPLVVGRDPHDVEALQAEAHRALNFVGLAGVSIIALSTLDTACWDIVGKAAGQPLWKLFGAARTAVPAYASGGLWLSATDDELVAEAEAFLAAGFRAMKVRLGKPTIEEDVRRVGTVRDAVGPEVALMADANQGLTVSHAVRLGRALEQFDLAWFEEPVPYWDLAGHAAIAAALDTPLASGETEYLARGMRAYIEAAAADILMPDLMRMGGLTELRRAAALCAAHGVPVSPHIYTEQSLAVAGSAPNCIRAEHMPWLEPLYRERMTLDGEGRIVLPDRPGLGFTFDPDAVDRFRVG